MLNYELWIRARGFTFKCELPGIHASPQTLTIKKKSGSPGQSSCYFVFELSGSVHDVQCQQDTQSQVRNVVGRALLRHRRRVTDWSAAIAGAMDAEQFGEFYESWGWGRGRNRKGKQKKLCSADDRCQYVCAINMRRRSCDQIIYFA